MEYKELKPEVKIPLASNNIWASIHTVIGALGILFGALALAVMIAANANLQEIGIVSLVFFGSGFTCLFMGDMIAKFHVIEHYSRQTARQAALTNAILQRSYFSNERPPVIKKETPLEEKPDDEIL